MDLEEAQESFRNILYSLNDDDKAKFCSWIQGHISSDMEIATATHLLKAIASYIKTLIPFDGVFSSEKIFVKENDGEIPVAHVDSFLFDDDDVDALVNDGNLNRNYCQKCGSFDILPIAFLSHSTSVERIIYMFKYMVPNLENKCLLDVGSRLGAILYGAYHCSKADRIIGVEMNKDLCLLQNKVIEKYCLHNRISIICDNICNLPDVISEADVIVFNNVFQYFMNKHEQTKAWRWLRKHITKRGTIVITVPSMEETLQNLETDIHIASWLHRRSLPDAMSHFATEGDPYAKMYMYTVI